MDEGISDDAEDNSKHKSIEKAIEKEASIEIIKTLLQSSTNVNHQNSAGETLLYMVLAKWTTSRKANNDYYTKITQTLIDRGADVNKQLKNGRLPLCFAMQKCNLCLVELLAENGADFSVSTNDGETLMHLFVSNVLNNYEVDRESKVTLFNLLINKGCQVNARDKIGTTPLHNAALHSHTLMVRQLVEHGAPVNCRNNQMETPLHFSTRNRDFSAEVAESLLELGANVNAKDSKGQTALHKIAKECRSSNSYVELSMLLQHAADVNARDMENCTALRCALSADHRNLQGLSLGRQLMKIADQFPFEVYSVNNNDLFNTLYARYGSAMDAVICLTKHSIKLKVANLPWDTVIDDCPEHFSEIHGIERVYDKYHEVCTQEVRKLKSFVIDEHTSLYTLLHVDPNGRRAYTNNEKLQRLIHSSNLDEQFPEYEVLILASYREAVTRKALLEPAKEAWLELTEIDLPDICIERIFSFLSNSDLFDIIAKE